MKFVGCEKIIKKIEAATSPRTISNDWRSKALEFNKNQSLSI